MASALLSPTTNSMNNLQMPNVFVHPPEEDHSPAWCYFDAAKRDFFDSALVSVNSSPFHRGRNAILASKRGLNEQPIFDALDRHPDDFIEHDIDYDCEADIYIEHDWEYHHQVDQRMQEPHDPPQCAWRDVANDSDVVEVFKVGRHTQDAEPTEAYMGDMKPSVDAKRSKTFKLRASKAFHTLKKVGRRKTSKRTATRDVTSPSPTLCSSSSSSVNCGAQQQALECLEMEEPPIRSNTPTLPRRGSVLLSQLFTAPIALKSRSSFSQVEDQLSTPFAQSDPLLPSDHPSPDPSHSPHPGCEIQESDSCLPTRSASPSPSFINKRRFSMINLQKLFTFTNNHSCSPCTHSPVPTGQTIFKNDGILSPLTLPSSECQPTAGTLYDVGQSSSRDVDHTRSSKIPSTCFNKESEDGVSPRRSVTFTAYTPSTMAEGHPGGSIRRDGIVEAIDPIRSSSKSGLPQAYEDQCSLAAELSLNLGSDLDLELGADLGLPAALCSPSVKPGKNRKSFDRQTITNPHTTEDAGPGNVSFEMCLDSLHFDELSFDVNRF
ncbi:hypothetical protein AX17_004410 [Amanita inopinata Kibby_2008]|nr:hypothetical protein AX17_004410 [Amanita inopinata Kibby_2008]